jgi:AMP nucleosidase
MPSFKLHKYVSQILLNKKLDYRTGVVYTTNRRIWEWDQDFKRYLRKVRVLGIDMETATIFVTGLANVIARGALLLVSDRPMIPEGVKTAESDREVTKEYANLHLEVGIQALTKIDKRVEKIKHFRY